MTDSFWSWALFGLYVVFVSWIAWRSQRRTESMESYSVGTRQVSPVAVGMSLAASLTSAATFVINPGLIYLYGWSGVVGSAIAAPRGILLGLIIFSKSFRRIGDRTRVLTVPQWIGDRFGDRRLAVWFSVLSLLQITFLVLIVVGLTLVLEQALAIPAWVALGIVVVFTFAYILLGGAGTHILTNTMQASIMIVVAFLFLGSGLEHFADGVGGFFDRLAAVGPHYAEPTNPASLLFRDWFETFVANFVVGIAIILQPHIISKSLYLRSEADVNRYLATAAVVAGLFFAVLVTGLFARLSLDGEPLAPDVVMATYMVSEFTSFTRAVVVLGLLAAGFSTMEGILVALSSIFSNDFLRNVMGGGRRDDPAWQARSLVYARWFLIALAPVTVALSWKQIVAPSLSVAIFAQNGVYGLFAATFVPVLLGVFTTSMARGWIFAASATAVVVHFGMYYGAITMYHNNPAVPATAAIVASSVVGLVGLAVGRKDRAEARARPGAGPDGTVVAGSEG
ncbi:MAG: sodium:solute symporter [Gemmatimonadota bacterium]